MPQQRLTGRLEGRDRSIYHCEPLDLLTDCSGRGAGIAIMDPIILLEGFLMEGRRLGGSRRLPLCVHRNDYPLLGLEVWMTPIRFPGRLSPSLQRV